MDATHLHLLLNHFPIIGTLIGTVLLIISLATKNEAIQKASLATIFLMALIAIPVFLTGEPAEERVEKLPGVVESMMEAHEEAAETAFWVMMVTGVISFVALLLQFLQHQIAKTVVILALIASLATSALMARTGYLGGQIRHTEIRSDASGAQPDPAATGEEEEEEE